MPHTRTLAAFVLLAVLTPAVGRPEPTLRTFAVLTPPGADDLVAAVEDGSFKRWFARRDRGIALKVGADVRGDVEVLVRLLPVEDAIRRRLAGLPVELSDDAIVLGGKRYRDERLGLALRLPGTDRLTFLVAAHSLGAAAQLTDLVLIANNGGGWRTSVPEGIDYLLWEHPYSQRSGRWVASGSGYTAEDVRDDLTERAAAYAAMGEIRRPGARLRLPRERAGEKAFTDLADALDAAVTAMAPRLGTRGEASPVEVFVDDDFLVQGRRTAQIRETVLDHDGSLHLVYHPDDLDLYRYGLARLLVRRAGLELPPALEDGAALWLSRGWYGRPYEDWLGDFAAADVLPTAAEILAGRRAEDASAVLDPPAAAAVVERLPGKTLQEKLNELPSEAAVASILKRVASTPTPPRKTAATLPSFLNGVSFAMLNGLEVGYHAPGVDEQLDRVRELGSDSVSLMPFAYQRDPKKPGMGFLNSSPGSETDVGMIHSARRAHAHGLTVLWKPHIWVRHDSWPGDIEMTSEDDWKAWFRSYRRYTLHHAVLARYAGSELFSIGVELGRTVHRETDWRFLIAAVRRVYPGLLTYAGNWHGDYDQVPFWDALDLVGVDAYFPLAYQADADRAELVRGAQGVVERLRAAAEKTGKPIVLTEVGFAARKAAWVEPHGEGGEVSEEDQRLAYEVLLGTLGRPDWLGGVYVWKVFSHSRREVAQRPDFSILGRPAEAVVRGYFRGDGGVRTSAD